MIATLEARKDEIRNSRAQYAMQMAACDGALKLIDEMLEAWRSRDI